MVWNMRRHVQECRVARIAKMLLVLSWRLQDEEIDVRLECGNIGSRDADRHFFFLRENLLKTDRRVLVGLMTRSLPASSVQFNCA